MPSDDPRAIYRERIYAGYVSARDRPLAPTNLDGLAPRLPYFRQMIRRHFPENTHAAILELGCGHGTLLYALQQAGYRNARGVDGSPEQVGAARRLGIQGVSEGNVMDVLRETSAASQDVVVAFDLIEHFTKVELVGLIDAVHRVLKPDGRWIIHVPNAEGPFGSRMRYGDYTHELAFTRQSLAQVLLSSGFSGVRCFEDRPVLHGLKSLVRAGWWTVIRAGLLFYIAVETGAFDHSAVFSQNLLAVARREM
ncbi:bifunctional 2-polyprenyl-6-hydroxyphenol methylase/3-demethylubiquinol 3-O-methyltransferase UbiG [Acidithiobacillus sp.]|jgi:SAM-dependent methyltransferase|uniref:class I SAM-dependent methyltransferase n=1 Tax=Acidithiobacillus sp. TaxID=1872118 RepID=UPI0025BE231C|nr:class I SAM-dependent methyltransferase [Acidithiobacillus sp.]MCK9187956.1 class I SAM-dependent methyltransferase [Acidithiobacillus sp.]MCK9359915.1 class I SAM-dependent methyltransferase [Acidithiobacillus sp.]